MDVDADKLTEVLAARLAAIAPDGFHVRASDGMLWYPADPGRFPGQLSKYYAGRSGTFVRDNFQGQGFQGQGEITEESLVQVAAQALDELQDYVDEASHDPWPGTHSPPRPFALVHGQMLCLWYGEPDIASPVVLPCEPIPLSQIRRSP